MANNIWRSVETVFSISYGLAFSVMFMWKPIIQCALDISRYLCPNEPRKDAPTRTCKARNGVTFVSPWYKQCSSFLPYVLDSISAMFNRNISIYCSTWQKLLWSEITYSSRAKASDGQYLWCNGAVCPIVALLKPICPYLLFISRLIIDSQILMYDYHMTRGEFSWFIPLIIHNKCVVQNRC